MMRPMDHPFTSDDILGREAVDPEGEILGTITRLHIDRDGKHLTGITVDQGLLRADLFIGMDFVDKFGEDVVFLNAIPVEKYAGRVVIQSDGKKVGRVRGIVKSLSAFEALEVRLKGPFWNRRTVRVGAADIQKIGRNVLLRIEIAGGPERENGKI